MKHRTAAALVVLLATASLSPGQAPEAPTLPQPQPVAARPPLPGLPALAHEVGESLEQSPEYVGLATAPTSPAPPIDEAPERWWLRGEYLFWWLRHAPVAAPLAVNEAPGGGTPFVFGSDAGHFDPFSGARLALGYWIDAERTWGAEVGGFFLQSQTRVLDVQSDSFGNPPIVRPIVGARGEPTLVPVSIVNVLSGGVTSRESLSLSGVGADLVWGAFGGPGWRVELLAGYRHLDLHESLAVVQASQVQAPVGAGPLGFLDTGTTLLTYDAVGTSNHFDGGRLGSRVECAWGPCYLRLSGDVGLGANTQVIRASGATHLLPGAGPAVLTAGGVLVGAGGDSSRDRAAFVSGLGAEGGFIVTSHVRLFAAYSLLFWDKVARPGDQIGAAGPALPFRTSDFWAQGVSAGLEVRW